MSPSLLPAHHPPKLQSHVISDSESATMKNHLVFHLGWVMHYWAVGIDFPTGAGFACAVHLKWSWRQMEGGRRGCTQLCRAAQARPGVRGDTHPLGSPSPVMPGLGFLRMFCNSNCTAQSRQAHMLKICVQLKLFLAMSPRCWGS